MKYLYLFLIPVLVFIGCSSDNDDVSINNDNILGHWVSISSHDYTLNKETGVKIISEEFEDNSLSLTLYKDGTCSKNAIYSKDDEINGYYKLLGNVLNVSVSTYHGNFSFHGTYDYVIESLSSNKMILSHNTHSDYLNEYYTVYTMKRK